MDNRKTRELYLNHLNLQNNFRVNDWFITIRLNDIVNKEQYCSDLIKKLIRKVYPNRPFREDNPNIIKSFAVIGHTDKIGDRHHAAHILISDVDYRSSSIDCYEHLLYSVFGKNRKNKEDIDIRQISDVGGVIRYCLNEQGADVTVVTDAIRVDT